MEKSIREYIINNKFNSILHALNKGKNNLSVLKILKFSLEKSHTLEDEIFIDSTSFIKEFNTGLDLYFLLSKSKINEEAFLRFSNTFWILLEKIVATIEELITEMKKNIDLNFEEDSNYYQYYEIREKLQELINFLKKKDKLSDITRISKIKANLSNLMDYEISKEEIGNDMLQLADSYLKRNKKEESIKIYKAILNDFAEGYSVSISNGNFSTVGKTIVRLDGEIEIYNKARIIIKNLTGEEFPSLMKQEQIYFEKVRPKQKKSIWSKFKGMFKIK